MTDTVDNMANAVMEQATLILSAAGMLDADAIDKRAVTMAVMDCYEAAYKAGAERMAIDLRKVMQ
jgi:hypothetical protein